jgi:hypothetical protein
MTQSAEVCVESAMQNGVDFTYHYKKSIVDIRLDDSFIEFNEDILKQDRGCGYWLWKPFIIALEMTEMKDGDILIYSDAGVKWINNVNEIISRMDQDIFLFSNGHQHIYWTKMCIMAGICREPIPESYTQVQASVIFFKVNSFTRKFVKEWLLFCQMPGWIDDSESILPNVQGFAENRHDQAILSTLAYKYSIKQHWWADKLWYESQRGRWPDDKYPSMFEHHRKRNNEW